MLVENQKIQQKWNKRNKQWYVDKGYKFTEFKDVFYVSPTDLTNGSHIKVDVICDYCRNIVSVAWKDYVKYKYDKYSCKHCRQAKTNEYNLTKRQRYLYDGIVSVCKEKGYTLLTPIEYIKTAETRVKYLCDKHGVNETKAYTLFLGHGCPLCSHEENADKMRYDADYVAKRISEYGGVLLNKEDYIGWDTKNLIVKCPMCGKPFITSYNSFTHNGGQFCQSCTKDHSVGEGKIEEYLCSHNIFFLREYRFNDCKDKSTLPFDFYLQDYNIVIEYQGKQHYEPVDYFGGDETFARQVLHDKIKEEYCKSNNIYLLVIPYWDFDFINDILDETLNLHDDIV